MTVEEAAPYSLVVSRSADRSNASALQGASVSQNVYVFTSPDTSGIAGVRFYLDDPAMTGSPRRRESNAPYDFNGGTVELANAFDTRALANGSHTITAAIELSAGGEHVLHASFEVRN